MAATVNSTEPLTVAMYLTVSGEYELSRDGGEKLLQLFKSETKNTVHFKLKVIQSSSDAKSGVNTWTIPMQGRANSHHTAEKFKIFLAQDASRDSKYLTLSSIVETKLNNSDFYGKKYFHDAPPPKPVNRPKSLETSSTAEKLNDQKVLDSGATVKYIKTQLSQKLGKSQT